MFSAVKISLACPLRNLPFFHGDDVIGVGGGLVDVVQDDDGSAFVFVGQPAQDLHEERA